jgi:SH3-like domain-containing protein
MEDLNRTISGPAGPAALLAGVLLTASCTSGPSRERAIGEAFVGPVSVNLRDELTARAGVSATVRHGERLEIIERRRRFARVRTAKDATGWIDGRLLLSTEQMQRLRGMAQMTAQVPSQAKATAFDLLNVHTTPNRQSPSFHQLPETEPVDVIGQLVTPRVPYSGYFPNGYDPDKVPPTADLDDWHLIRLRDGRAGWVLARMLLFSIPDEVAQYAEGARITSYFSLGTVEDRGETKHHWLWTTVNERYQPHDFDSLRVFVWSKLRHRYETSYIERNMRGYYPVEVEKAGEQEPGSLPSFTVIAENKEGVTERRTYEFRGLRPKLAAREPARRGGIDFAALDAISNETPEAEAGGESLLESLRRRWRKWRGE